MAQKIVDISKYFNNDQPQMTLLGKTYTVKNDKTTVLLLNEIQRKAKADDMTTDEKIVRLLLGETAGNEVLEILDTCANYAQNERAVLLNIIALATGQEYEDLEARFQKSQQ